MEINDRNVVQQLTKRNEKALYYIIDCYGGLIKKVIQKYLYQFESVQEECLDDVLLLVWGNIGSYDERRNSLKNWIAAIAKYKAIDYQRKYQKCLDQRDIDDRMVESPFNIEAHVTENLLSKTTERMLSHLKKEDQTLFIKHYGEEKSIDELANETGMEKSVIYNRLSRGRKKLRILFQHKAANEK
ncbi:sigma-70 family RNA polymerase sigma factor [Niallia sp. NCCP-28]|uniref:sigma-70 family RNA polymerase sigma factor n=1 Tax=Niallia sp. NCCP-28 TaxID=2934712 RepID=UPI002082E55D|nr:sigma-70 family RNA polymerase sigma factor [Niallia sp. NCCP-28]GKU83041.1 DNA-directed RNA polymerase sigma-70 factor [Niallia sp. NCCP-28]